MRSGAPRTIGPWHHKHLAGNIVSCLVPRFRLSGQAEWPASRYSRYMSTMRWLSVLQVAPIRDQNDHPDHLPGLTSDDHTFGKCYP